MAAPSWPSESAVLATPLSGSRHQVQDPFGLLRMSNKSTTAHHAPESDQSVESSHHHHQNQSQNDHQMRVPVHSWVQSPPPRMDAATAVAAALVAAPPDQDMDEELLQLLLNEAQDFKSTLNEKDDEEEDRVKPPSSSSSPPQAHTKAQDQPQVTTANTTTQLVKKPAKSNPKRRRPRTELLELREQVEVLQKELERLRQRCRMSLGTDPMAPNSYPGMMNALVPMMPLMNSSVWPDDENLAMWVAAQWSSWRQIAHQEMIQRQQAEQMNQKLRKLAKRQIQMSRKMHQMVKKRVNVVEKGMADHMGIPPPSKRHRYVHDKPAAEAKARTSATSSPPSPASSSSPSPPTSPISNDQDLHVNQKKLPSTPTKDQTWLGVLLERIELAFQHTDLVFSQHTMLSSSSSLGIGTSDDKLFIHEDFAEIAGCLVTPIDAQTFVELLWKNFIWQPSGSQNSGQNPARASSIFESYERNVQDDVIHGQGNFSTMLSHSCVQVKSHGALKKFADVNVIVWESIGTLGLVLEDPASTTHAEEEEAAAPASPSNSDASSTKDIELDQHQTTTQQKEVDVSTLFKFSRTVWCRVEPLSDGKAMMRHVSRMQPTDSSKFTGPDKKKHLQLLAELMQLAHGEIADHFRKMMLEDALEHLEDHLIAL